MARHIVVIDDDQDDLDMMSELLGIITPDSKHQIFVEPLVAVDWLLDKQNREVDCIFSDVNMPKMSGLQVLMALRARYHNPQVPIVIYSTSMTPEAARQLRINGATFTFQKPHRFDDYLTVVRDILNEIPTAQFKRHA